MEESQTPPSDEELQQRLEEQLRKVRVQDLLLESVASILNLSARRIAKEDERDLDQGRVGIEAVRAVLESRSSPSLASRSARPSHRCRCFTLERRGTGDEPDAAPAEPAPEQQQRGPLLGAVDTARDVVIPT